MREDQMTPEERRILRRRKAPAIHRWEQELRAQLDLAPERFRRVRWDRWRGIYQAICQRFVNRTQTWKNGLHWANTNGYSPWAMERLAGTRRAEPDSWFSALPELLPQETGMVYFLLDLGGDPCGADSFWLFEGFLSQLLQVLALLNQTAFLGLGWPDYYIVSQKYRWIIGYNHHDVVSLAGEGFSAGALAEFLGPPA